ncbi:MAG: DUF2723 domain-containing protein [Chloroflexi bacterium]|nr:DUF2723 domain-containing protein [Chloroflexota bacterium]
MNERRGMLAVFVLSLAFYTATLAPTVQWGDFGGYQTRITIGELELAPQGHPLWNLIARPFTKLPFGDAAWRVNFTSAFFAALALSVLYLTLVRLSRSRTAAALAVLGLAVSHTFWTYAVVPKAYSLTLLMLALCIHWLVAWRTAPKAWHLPAIGVTMGLGVMNHLIVVTAMPAVMVFIAWDGFRRRRVGSTRAAPTRVALAVIRDLAVYVLTVTIGFTPYLLLLSAAPSTGATTGGFVTSNLVKFAELLTSPTELLVGIGLTVGNLGYQFFFLTFVGAWGWWHMARRDPQLAALVMLIFLGDVAFVLIPTEPPVMMHWHLYHPAYLAFAYPLMWGIADLLAARGDTWRARAGWIAVTVLPVLAVYFVLAPGVARLTGITERLGVRDLPGRDTVAFLFTPSKAGDYGARRFGEAVFQGLPARAVIFADWTPYAALWYLQRVEGVRPDVTVSDLPDQGTLLDAVNRYRGSGRSIFLADNSRYYDLALLQTQYRIEPTGVMYRLVPLVP